MRLKIIGTRVDATEIVRTISITLFTMQLIVRFSLGFGKWSSIIFGLGCALLALKSYQFCTFVLILQFCVGTIKDDFLGVINDPAAA